MKRCPSCGQETKDDSQEFCIRCGAYFVAGHKPSAAQGASLPEDPLDRGCALMDFGSFGDAVRTWDDGVRSGGIRVDDAAYRRILDSTVGCMLGTVLQPQMYNAAAMPQFAAAMPERELITDLMAKLATSLDVCSIQNGVLGLANPYMYLYLDGFGVYTDIRDLGTHCDTACAALGAMVERAFSLPEAMGVKGPGPMEWLTAYRDFAAAMADEVSSTASSISSEEAEAIADGWSKAPSLEYLEPIRVAFAANSKAVPAGRFASRALIKTRDSQIRLFSKRYLKQRR